MSLSTSLRTAAAEMAHSLSPIRLFNMEQARKLGSDLAREGMPLAIGGRFPTMGARRAAAIKGIRETGLGPSLGSYFRGHYMEDATMSKASWEKMSQGKAYMARAASRAMARQVAAGVVGAGVLGTTMMGPDNIVSATGRAGITAGMAGGAAFGAAEFGARRGAPGMGRLAAGGIGAVTVLNMLRRGDQWGPF